LPLFFVETTFSHPTGIREKRESSDDES